MRFAIVVAGLLLMSPSAAGSTIPIQITEVVWRDAPPTLPQGSKIASLEGDPKKEGLFTMRIKVPAGARIPPHFHSRAERVTVLWGEVRVGFGDRFDIRKTRLFPAGSYYVNPPEVHHYLYFPRTAVLQLTGDGPWELHPVR